MAPSQSRPKISRVAAGRVEASKGVAALGGGGVAGLAVATSSPAVNVVDCCWETEGVIYLLLGGECVATAVRFRS